MTRAERIEAIAERLYEYDRSQSFLRRPSWRGLATDKQAEYAARARAVVELLEEWEAA